MSDTQESSLESKSQTLVTNSENPQPQTPLNVKRQQIREHFMSPTDNVMSPCTARIMAAHGKKPKGGLLRQTFKVPAMAFDKENSSVLQQGSEGSVE